MRGAVTTGQTGIAMDSSDIVIALVVATALGFDFTNGFHDTANAMATSIATRALPPKLALRGVRGVRGLRVHVTFTSK